MAAASKSSNRDTGIGKAGVQGVGVIALTLLLGGISLSLVYGMVAFWPQSDTNGKITGTTAVLLGQTVTLDPDRSVLVLVILAGATGASAAVLRSFFKYAGRAPPGLELGAVLPPHADRRGAPGAVHVHRRARWTAVVIRGASRQPVRLRGSRDLSSACSPPRPPRS